MDILPAVDLLDGKCVRLVQGRYDRVIEYESEPLAVVTRFRDAGAAWVHVVDLDGARAGRIANLHVLEQIAATGMRIQFGGGIRDEAGIRDAINAGAARVIVGTAALDEPESFRKLAGAPEWSGKLTLGIDARLGKVAIRGRSEQTERTAIDLAESVADWPLAAIVYTDIGRDGMLLGPNIEAIRNLSSMSTVPVIASGGVTDLDDVRRLARQKLAGIVIGRAIYEKTLDLAEALQVVRGA